MKSKLNFKWIFFAVLVVLIIAGCKGTDDIRVEQKLIYPETEQVQQADYTRIVYVSKNGQDSEENGPKENPYLTVPFALSQIQNASAENRAAVLISQGEYSGETIELKEYVDFYGGFNEQTWERNLEKFITVLSGGEERRVLIAENNMKLDGFHITRGEIKGKGAALFCDGTSPKISNNIFMDNKTLAPDNWNPKYLHETANDGGAIFGQNEASPTIRNNIFINNKTENGRGAAISFDGRCKPVIIQNVFFSNIAGLDDPMRSSDGGAISIFDWSDAVIDENVFISNRAQSKNDGGAVFIALWSSAKVEYNLFVDSYAGDDAGALFVGGQEHRYDGPLDPIPPKEQFFVIIKNNTFIGNHHGGTNSGAMRFTMESRGEFVGNTVAHNNGVYFQRSEVNVSNNIILDNFLFIETKEGLEKGTIQNNILWADYDQEVEADVKNNNMFQLLEGNGNYHKAPEFVSDGFEIVSISTNYKRQNFSTLVTVAGLKFKKNQLLNRVIRAGTKWGVIKSNTANTITIWGDFIGMVNFTVLPTYSLVK